MSRNEPRPSHILRCIAVDDEPFALKLLEDDISRVPFLKLVASCSSPAEAVFHLNRAQVDLLFLDIQMPTTTGTEFIRNLPNPPMVIFTTAYEQFALEGFELNVVDYLVKPIPFERFLKAANKAYDLFSLKASNPAVERPFFFVRAEYKEIKIFFDDILFIEGLKDYVKIFLASQPRPILTRLNLKAIESKLPRSQFCRIHNSFIVSLDKIEAFQKAQVFIGQRSIPIGDKYAADFIKVYKPG